MTATTNSQALATPEVSATASGLKGGPILTLVNLGLAISSTVILLLVQGISIESLHEAMKLITKIGFPFFILTAIARPLHDLIGNPATRWMLGNRRYIGLSFASWHLMHWPILAGMMLVVGPVQFWDDFQDFIIPAGCVLLVITLMAATSNNRSVRFLGKPVWSAIHTIGLYVIGYWFVHVYLSRLEWNKQTYTYVYLGLIFAALAFRWVMTVTRFVKKRRQR
ncbi:MAG: putative sulfite oxidase subunit YedZ [Myxococcales bacterium]|nr:putative sulfite oxidase subunit YedZ [Myxococcales bacterium]